MQFIYVTQSIPAETPQWRDAFDRAYDYVGWQGRSNPDRKDRVAYCSEHKKYEHEVTFFGKPLHT